VDGDELDATQQANKTGMNFFTLPKLWRRILLVTSCLLASYHSSSQAFVVVPVAAATTRTTTRGKIAVATWHDRTNKRRNGLCYCDTAPCTVPRSSLSHPHLHLALFPPELLLSSAESTVQATASGALNWYTHLLQTHPIATKATTAAVLASMGDAIAQFRAAKATAAGDGTSPSFQYDVRRGMGFLLFGAAYTGAFQHFWFSYLNAHVGEWGQSLGIWGGSGTAVVPVDDVVDLEDWWRYFDVVAQLENPPSPAALAIAKLAVNQFLMIPVVYMPLFFAVTGFLGGMDAKQSWARAQSLYFPLLRRNYFYWLPVQFFQFLVR
jgi:Mpv17 / PMP22 family